MNKSLSYFNLAGSMLNSLPFTEHRKKGAETP
jgi:hypothetical protein